MALRSAVSVTYNIKVCWKYTNALGWSIKSKQAVDFRTFITWTPICKKLFYTSHIRLSRTWKTQLWSALEYSKLYLLVTHSKADFISQGSVATRLGSDGIFNNRLIANLLHIISVKEFWKYVNTWCSYGFLFIGPLCRYCGHSRAYYGHIDERHVNVPVPPTKF